MHATFLLLIISYVLFVEQYRTIQISIELRFLVETQVLMGFTRFGWGNRTSNLAIHGH